MPNQQAAEKVAEGTANTLDRAKQAAANVVAAAAFHDVSGLLPLAPSPTHMRDNSKVVMQEFR